MFCGGVNFLPSFFFLQYNRLTLSQYPVAGESQSEGGNHKKVWEKLAEALEFYDVMLFGLTHVP